MARWTPNRFSTGLTRTKTDWYFSFDQISKEEMDKTFKQLKMDVSSQEIDMIFQALDKESKGEIKITEFQKMIDDLKD